MRVSFRVFTVIGPFYPFISRVRLRFPFSSLLCRDCPPAGYLKFSSGFYPPSNPSNSPLHPTNSSLPLTLSPTPHSLSLYTPSPITVTLSSLATLCLSHQSPLQLSFSLSAKPRTTIVSPPNTTQTHPKITSLELVRRSSCFFSDFQETQSLLPVPSSFEEHFSSDCNFMVTIFSFLV